MQFICDAGCTFSECFNEDGIVCPPKMCGGVIIMTQVDNYIMAKASFQDTGI